MPKRIEFRPVLKPFDDGSPTSFIYFDEDVELPGGDTARVSLHFDRENSFDETSALISELKRRGMRVVIERAK